MVLHAGDLLLHSIVRLGFFIPGGHSEVNSDVSLYIGSGVLSTFSIIQWKEETSALVIITV